MRRCRNSCTASSISEQIRDTVDRLMPVSLPRARTNCSTLRVETPVDPGLADHCVECFVDPPSRVQQRREERAFPQFRDLQVDFAGRCGEQLRARPVAARRPFRGSVRNDRRRSSRSLPRRRGLAGRPAASDGTRPGARARDRRELHRSGSSRQTGTGSSWDLFFASCRKQLVIPRCPSSSTTTRTPPREN